MTIQETKKLVKTKIKVDHNGLWTVKLAGGTYDITVVKNVEYFPGTKIFDVSQKSVDPH